MGNCCGKSSGSNFQGEGRTLGSAPAPAPIDQAPRPIPALQPNATNKTPGGSDGGVTGGNARSAAARAAEERASKAAAATQKGKLSQQLAQQKNLTQEGVLKANAEEERRFREVDQGNKTLAHQ